MDAILQLEIFENSVNDLALHDVEDACFLREFSGHEHSSCVSLSC